MGEKRVLDRNRRATLNRGYINGRNRMDVSRRPGGHALRSTSGSFDLLQRWLRLPDQCGANDTKKERLTTSWSNPGFLLPAVLIGLAGLCRPAEVDARAIPLPRPRPPPPAPRPLPLPLEVTDGGSVILGGGFESEEATGYGSACIPR